MKKQKVLITLLLVIVFGLLALASGSSDTAADQGTGTVTPAEDNAALGDYTVEIDSCRLAKDFEGTDVVIVKYIFTNVSSDSATSFAVAIDENVYQNGVGLTESYFLEDSANYNADNQLKEIKKGASIEVEVAYELNDAQTEIEVEVSELFSFSDKVITKTFSIS